MKADSFESVHKLRSAQMKIFRLVVVQKGTAWNFKGIMPRTWLACALLGLAMFVDTASIARGESENSLETYLFLATSKGKAVVPHDSKRFTCHGTATLQTDTTSASRPKKVKELPAAEYVFDTDFRSRTYKNKSFTTEVFKYCTSCLGIKYDFALVSDDYYYLVNTQNAESTMPDGTKVILSVSLSLDRKTPTLRYSSDTVFANPSGFVSKFNYTATLDCSIGAPDEEKRLY